MSADSPGYSFAGVPRVNLMPRAEMVRRARNKVIRRWSLALVAAMAVILLATAGSYALLLGAQQRLSAENARTTALLGDLAALADVRSTLDLQSELSAFRAEAMATDLEWSSVLATVQRTLPDGVTVEGFSLAPGGVPQGEDPSAAVGASGTLSLASATPHEIVPIVRALRPVPGVLDIDGWQSTASETGYTYELRVEFDQSVYSGDYAADEDEK
ncbi:hypothetical protein K0817_011430 [Microbacterium sp. HD4P20]|uniref:hypothetical protein n=1 Tax=Microbacterium sp. HD4P20 TaxID=2864874 RepID=UPI001C641669|nr:hypothetical protein [Microbacterium sp. HD4P20]MCP2637170.1 hypothetical protein [Microbacterium sp. HD4P20]